MNGTGAEVPMKLKIFLVKSGNSVKKAGLADLDADVNQWLVDHLNITIDHTHTLGGPNLGWNLTALAVWYTES